MSTLEIILIIIVLVLFISNCVWIERYIKANEFADKVERWRHEDILKVEEVLKIKKVEKKVKDLTLEECEQLNIDYLDYAATRNVYRHGYSDTIDLSMDEYIDITHLVKGDAEV